MVASGSGCCNRDKYLLFYAPCGRRMRTLPPAAPPTGLQSSRKPRARASSQHAPTHTTHNGHTTYTKHTTRPPTSGSKRLAPAITTAVSNGPLLSLLMHAQMPSPVQMLAAPVDHRSAFVPDDHARARRPSLVCMR